jgi:RNA polymerase sigma factor (sigma-70 family)
MGPTDETRRFLALFHEHRAILYKVAFGYCRNREDRVDLVQEMAIQLWRSFGRYDGRVKFSTWAYRVAMNVAISHFRGEGLVTKLLASMQARLPIVINVLRSPGAPKPICTLPVYFVDISCQPKSRPAHERPLV